MAEVLFLGAESADLVNMERRRAGVTRGRSYNLQRSPVNLPTELLAEIFLNACLGFGVGNRSTVPRLSIPKLMRNRWSITAVCHRWREVANSTTSLWNQIVVLVFTISKSPFRHIEHIQPNLATLRLALTRSAQAPLDIKVSGFDASKHRGDHGLVDLLRLALPTCRRLEFDETGPRPEEEWRLPNLLFSHPTTPIHLDSLQSLICPISTHGGIRLSHTSHLRQLSLRGRADTRHVSSSPSLSNLTHLALHDVQSLDATLSTLDCSKSLRVLVIQGYTGLEDDTSTWSPIFLPALEHLSYAGINSGYLHSSSSLISYIEAPGLAQLQLGRVELLSRPNQFPCLQTLDLYHAYIEESNTEHLRHVPSVTNLVFPSLAPHGTRYILLGALLRRSQLGGSFEFLPDLTTVYWDLKGITELSMQRELMEQFVKARSSVVIYVPSDGFKMLRKWNQNFIQRYPNRVLEGSYEVPSLTKNWNA